MWQELIVGAIVLVAAVSLAWRFMPAGLRSKLMRVHPSLAPAARGGRCGGCSACGGDSCSDTRKA
ncbi:MULTISPECIES: hypothetical protein [Comamonas]|jgi:hypothetical protein|uniref:hypothetical protein n=1 Tax=Comamonas TaxID=283 RepID=UPI0012BF3DFD|nr:MULTISPECIES: hypothetical protein [Comamonas]MDR3066173.1 hypothetical protein [Comamonas sp.]MEB5963956.1 hypothetical protein [Comamonas testosteroni]MPS94466.1 hypothetical protein [Comamonas sp.]